MNNGTETWEKMEAVNKEIEDDKMEDSANYPSS